MRHNFTYHLSTINSQLQSIHFPKKSSTYTKVLAEPFVVLSCTVCFYHVLKSTTIYHIRQALAFTQSEDHQILSIAPSSIVSAAAASTHFMPLPFLQPYTFCLPGLL